MAFRRLITAALLVSAAASGDYEYGQRTTSGDNVPGTADSDIPVSVSPRTTKDVYKRGSNAKFVGLNICGFDFGCDKQGSCDIARIDAPLPNVPPAYSSPHEPLGNGPAQMLHFVSGHNFNIFRLPVSWQYLVDNVLGGPLDPTNFGYYDYLVRECLGTGSYCMIDLHNYARWDGKMIGMDDGPSVAQFAELWGQLAANYKDDERVWFGIMNEPYDLPWLSSWKDTVQAAVTAIRGAGAAKHFISLPGTGFQSPGYLVYKGDGDALKEVTNPDGTTTNLVFDVHLYLDAGGTGRSRRCVTSGIEWSWAPLAEWLRNNGRQAIVSETGAGDTPSCETYFCQQLQYLDDNSDVFLGYVIWAAGSFRSSYELSMTPFVQDNYWEDVPLLTKCVSR
ncbi:hypothetical protein KVR01_013046 [Diaporthe batatas]|uniref:uncharacterized protein n=1 Tax=Diaporthe batatas TaxID=748121 RepID=UPI001D044B04|nr:uncharacterized protein KVR01_013046 [Diaporthe batatas]KAG8157056.1 hypothetical protein KVR01_013046 [Diaporthe batatas]